MWIGDRVGLKFNIQNIIIYRNDDIEMWDTIFSINPEKKERVEDKQVNVMVSKEKVKNKQINSMVSTEKD